MKATCVFLLLSLALCWYQGFAEANAAAGRGTEPACGKFNLSKGCSKIFEPVCGTDDVVYGNECLLCLENLERRTNVRIRNRGMCQKPSPRSN